MEALKDCAGILRKVMANQAAYYFLAPVDPVAEGIPHYTTVIERPMDLGTIKAKLAAYEAPEAFAADMRLVFANATRFNVDPGDAVHTAALECSALFEAKWADFLGKRQVPSPPRAPVAAPSPPSNRRLTKEAAPRPLRLALSAVLRSLMAKKEAKLFFNDPVDPIALNVPHYPAIVKEPMDLGTIRDRLKQDAYPTLGAWARDVRLVFTNATTFNTLPDDPALFEAKHAELVQEFDGADAAAPATEIALAPRAEEEGRQVELEWARILEDLLAVPEAVYFRDPVDPVALNIPDYFDFIKRPMDLTTVSRQLPTYATAAAFAEDVRLVFHNAMTFSPDPQNDIHRARHLGDQGTDQLLEWARSTRLFSSRRVAGKKKFDDDDD